MFHWLRSSPPSASGYRGQLHLPQELGVEIALREELQQCAQRGLWRELLECLQSLEARSSLLGAGAIASIVNARSRENGPTLLHLVCGRENSKKLASALLRLGADPNATSYARELSDSGHVFDRSTPLFWAISHGDRAVCQLLLRHGADVHAQNILGETAIAFLVRTGVPYGVWRSIRKDLLNAGGDPSTPNNQGSSPLAVHIINQEWDAAREFVSKGATLLPCSGAVVRAAIKTLKDRGEDALRRDDKTTELLKYLIDDLEALAPAFKSNEIHDILNLGHDGRPGLFGQMLLDGQSEFLVKRAIKLGASFSHRCNLTHNNVELTGLLPIHLAILSGNPRVVEVVLRASAGFELHQPVSGPQLNPLHILYVGSKAPNHEITALLLSWKVDPRYRSADGVSLFEKAVACKDVTGMYIWAEYEVNSFALTNPLTQKIGLHDDDVQTQKRELLEFANLRVSLPVAAEGEMLGYAGDPLREGFARRARDYIGAYNTAVSPGRWTRTSVEFHKMLPTILLSEKIPSVVTLLRGIDRLNDLDETARGFHPFESELMALLAHPARGEERRELVRASVLSLTSINRFLSFHVDKVPASTVSLWGRIGIMGFSFRAWKWDTRGVNFGDPRGASLFEQFGFEPLEREGGPGVFGQGFVLSAERKERVRQEAFWRDRQSVFDPATRVEFHRGLLLASHSTHGTLIVRNSSPIFGRDLLRHPAYFSRFAQGQGFGRDEFTHLTPSLIEGSFTQVLHGSLYSTPRSVAPELEFLLTQLEEVRQSYGCWKFDTDPRTAWERIEGVGTALHGGYYSEGYASLVEYLARSTAIAREGSARSLALAFFDRRLPPWVPLRFTDLDGQSFSTLRLDVRTLSLLKKLTDSTASKKDFKDDNGRTYEFFQKGLDAGAELVIVDEKEDSYGD